MTDHLKVAISLGAVTSRTWMASQHSWSLPLGTHTIKEPFSIHFFDGNEREVGYYIYSLQKFQVLDQPRTWSDYVKQHPDYILKEIGNVQ